MKRTRITKLFALSAVTALLLCSCNSTSNNVVETDKGESKIMKENEAKKYEYVSYDKIFDSYDEVFETEYTKFSLPEKSDVPITQPEGMYKLKISLVNAEQDVDWMADKAQKLADCFNMLDEYEIEKHEFEQTYDYCGDEIFLLYEAEAKDQHGNYIDVYSYSTPYIYWKEDDSINLNNYDRFECAYIDKQNYKDTSAPYTDLIDMSCDYFSKAGEIMGDQFVKNPNYVTTKYLNNNPVYIIYMCNSYKGVNVKYFWSIYGDDRRDGLDIINKFWDTKFIFNSEKQPAAMLADPTYTVSEEEQINDMLSLKGACDLLEDKLAPKAHFDFDRVELLYEIRGDKTSELKDPEAYATQDLYLSPTWYFIKLSDEPDNELFGAEYISVDCVTGDVSVKIL